MGEITDGTESYVSSWLVSASSKDLLSYMWWSMRTILTAWREAELGGSRVEG